MTTPTVSYVRGSVRLLDQTRLPDAETVLDCRSIPELVDAIRRLVVRGAPAIGVAAAWVVVVVAAAAVAVRPMGSTHSDMARPISAPGPPATHSR